jgi:hypothetical protein
VIDAGIETQLLDHVLAFVGTTGHPTARRPLIFAT